jgi:hypothetical protein
MSLDPQVPYFLDLSFGGFIFHTILVPHFPFMVSIIAILFVMSSFNFV